MRIPNYIWRSTFLNKHYLDLYNRLYKIGSKKTSKKNLKYIPKWYQSFGMEQQLE